MYYLHSLWFMYPGYTELCRPQVDIAIIHQCAIYILSGSCSLETHSIVDPRYILPSSIILYCSCTLDTHSIVDPRYILPSPTNVLSTFSIVHIVPWKDMALKTPAIYCHHPPMYYLHSLWFMYSGYI